MTCTTTASHCEACGAHATPQAANSGYSPCCNELITTARDCRDHHGEEARFQTALDEAVAAAGFESRTDFRTTDEAGWTKAVAAAHAAR